MYDYRNWNYRIRARLGRANRYRGDIRMSPVAVFFICFLAGLLIEPLILLMLDHHHF